MHLQPQRQTKQRPRVPPPSKIPSSAVEMPGDAVTFLDVQFGALELTSDTSSLDGSANEKYSSTTITGVDITSGSNAINTASATNSLDTETTQTSTVPYNTSSQMVNFIIIKSICVYIYNSITFFNIEYACNYILFDDKFPVV